MQENTALRTNRRDRAARQKVKGGVEVDEEDGLHHGAECGTSRKGKLRKSFPLKMRRKHKPRASEVSHLSFLQQGSDNVALSQIKSKPLPALGLSLNTKAITYDERPRSGSGASDMPRSRSKHRAAPGQVGRVDVVQENKAVGRKYNSRKSWHLEGNTLEMPGLQLGEKGLVMEYQELMPAAFRNMPANVQYASLGPLGRGASSVVLRAIHVPTMQLVAIKQTPVHDRSKRHQIAAELRTFGKSINPLWVPSDLSGRKSSSRLRSFSSTSLKSGFRAWTQEKLKTRMKILAKGLMLPQVFRPKSRTMAKSGRGNSPGSMLEEEDVETLQNCPYLVSFCDAFTSSSLRSAPQSVPGISQASEVSMVMELMSGSLFDFQERGLEYSEELIAHVARGSLLALAYLHAKGFLHRDIKPANILVSLDGAVKLSDFGIARKLDIQEQECLNMTSPKDLHHSSAHSFVGTASYMSPERINGESYSFASDIWSLGLTCLCLALGRFPIREEMSKGYWGVVGIAMGQVVPDPPPAKFSDEFCHFVCECLQLDPKNRPKALELLTHPFLTKGLDLQDKIDVLVEESYVPTRVAIRRFENGDMTVATLEELLYGKSLLRNTFKIEALNRSKNGNSGFSTAWTTLWERKCAKAETKTTILDGMSLQVDRTESTSQPRSRGDSSLSENFVGSPSSWSPSKLKSIHFTRSPLRDLAHGVRFLTPGRSRSMGENLDRYFTTAEAQGRALMKKSFLALKSSEQAVADLETIHRKIAAWYTEQSLERPIFTEKDVANLSFQLDLPTRTVRRRLNG